MDFRSTVFRCAPDVEGGGVPPKYAVKSSRVLAAPGGGGGGGGGSAGSRAAEALMLKERDQRRRHYLDRGVHEAAVTEKEQGGVSGVWSVVDFTGRYHRPLIEAAPALAIPGAALAREDGRPGSGERRKALERRMAAIQAEAGSEVVAAMAEERSRQRLKDYTGGPEKALLAVDAALEKRIMQAEAQGREAQAEAEVLAASRAEAGKRLCKRARSDDELALLQRISEGDEVYVRRLINVAMVDPVVACPLTGRTSLHMVWDQWTEGPKFKAMGFVKGAVETYMKDDPRYLSVYRGQLHAGRLGRGLPSARAVGEARREAEEEEEGDDDDDDDGGGGGGGNGGNGGNGGVASPEAVAAAAGARPMPGAGVEGGPKARRAAAALAACLSSEYLAALLIGSAKRLHRKQGTPWLVREWVNTADYKTGATPLHCAAEKGHAALLRDLVVLGGDLRRVNKAGETPLAIAVAYGQTETAELLCTIRAEKGLAAPASTSDQARAFAFRIGANVEDDMGRAPVHRVFEFWRHAEVAEDAWGDAMPGSGVAGVDRGAGPGTVRHGTKGVTAAMLRAQGAPLPLPNGHSAVSPSVRRAQAAASCKLLLLLGRAGADVSRPQLDGRTALHEAVRRRLPEAVRCLLCFGADHEAKDLEARSPLDLWRWQAGVVLTQEEQERRYQVGRLLKSWGTVQAAFGHYEFSALWSQWLRSPEVAGAKQHLNEGLQDALRDLRIDELQLVKRQSDRQGRIPKDQGWEQWAASELRGREDAAAPTPNKAADHDADSGNHRRTSRRRSQAAAAGAAAGAAAAGAKGGGNHSPSAAAAKAFAAHQSPLAKGRMALTAFDFGPPPVPNPQPDVPIKFRLDEYLYGGGGGGGGSSSAPSTATAPFKEPHRLDPYRDVPLLHKGMEVTPPSPVPYGRAAGDLARVAARRRNTRDALMADGYAPNSLRTSATHTVLGGTRYFATDPTQPVQVKPAQEVLADLQRHDAKVAALKCYAAFLGTPLAAPRRAPPEPEAIQRRPVKDMGGPPPMTRRYVKPESRAGFTEAETLPSFPLPPPGAALAAAATAATRNRARMAK